MDRENLARPRCKSERHWRLWGDGESLCQALFLAYIKSQRASLVAQRSKNPPADPVQKGFGKFRMLKAAKLACLVGASLALALINEVRQKPDEARRVAARNCREKNKRGKAPK